MNVLYELMPPLNFELSDQVNGHNGFELGDAEYNPHSMYEGECVTIWSVGTFGIGSADPIGEIQDWLSMTGLFEDEDEHCEASVWAVLCGADGVRYVFELDEFTSTEQGWVIDALRASIAHNSAS